MNPHKMNKVDVSSMTEQEQKAFKLYGKVPAKNLLTKMQKDRKYFDSGDYMMNKAGVGNAQPLGTAIPTPEGVPHASPPGSNSPGILSTSPTGNLPMPNHMPALNEPQSMPSAHAQAQPIGVPGQPQPIGIPGQPQPFSPHHRESMSTPNQASAGGIATHRGSVGVGISPAVPVEGGDTPHTGHTRRGSESHRISPPATLRDGSNPSSSFPIQHHNGGFGSSPVKASSLARRVDEEM